MPRKRVNPYRIALAAAVFTIALIYVYHYFTSSLGSMLKYTIDKTSVYLIAFISHIITIAIDYHVVTKGLRTFSDWTEFIASLFAVIATLASAIIALISKGIPFIRSLIGTYYLEKGNGADTYPVGILRNAVRYYIHPDCQNIDPSGYDDPRNACAVTDKLFSVMHKMLTSPTEHKYIMLLSDSGMGKTSFCLNYYVWHQRHKRRLFDLFVLPLGIPDVEDRISNIAKPGNTVLFLDALDEDTLAISDSRERLKTLLEATRTFRKVLVTCRTQFFATDEEIPKETGIVKLGPRAASEKAQYIFHKIYLSPFSDKHVRKYLEKVYPIWRIRNRRKAREFVEKIPDLCIRPMLLAHIDDLVNGNRAVEYSYELYEEMIDAWLTREEGVLDGIKKEPLREFSEYLAMDIYMNRHIRESERVPKEELAPLAMKWNITVSEWHFTNRSLLNRDAYGNYKFAHRSFMEYLFIMGFIKTAISERKRVVWTDQMKIFLADMIRKSVSDIQNGPLWILPCPMDREIVNGALLHSADLTGCDLHGLNFSNFSLEGANLDKADLSNCTFANCSIQWASFRGANVSNCTFDGISLSSVDFSDADLSNSVFLRVKGRAKLDGVKGVFRTIDHRG